jgi:hypothetical protein
LRLAWVGRFEPGQCLVERDQVGQVLAVGGDLRVEVDALSARAVPEALIVTGSLDQNAAHRQCSRGKEMTAPIPLLVLLIAGDAQIRFVNERCRLQRVRLAAVALARQPRSRQLAQFVIHFRQELARRARSAVGREVGCHRGTPSL